MHCADDEVSMWALWPTVAFSSNAAAAKGKKWQTPSVYATIVKQGETRKLWVAVGVANSSRGPGI